MKETFALFFSFLLFSQSFAASAGTAGAEGPAIKQHSIKTVCHATRAIYGHDGKIAKWLAHCHVEIWNGQEHPVFPDLTPESILRNGIHHLPPPTSPFYEKTEYDNAAAPPTSHARLSMNDILRNIQFLVDEARLRHHDCIETKAAIMHNLQHELPTSLKHKDEILAQLNGMDVTLPPNVGLYIGHLDSAMKEKVAELHAIQNNENLSAEQKLEALKAKQMEIHGYLDGHCQGAHPSIAHHEISNAVPEDLHKLQVALLMRRPGNQVEILHLPENAYEQRTNIIRSSAEAVLHHCAETGQVGHFMVHSSHLWSPEQELALRQLAGHDYYGPYQTLRVPRTFIVRGVGNNEVVEGVKNSHQEPIASNPAVGTTNSKQANLLDLETNPGLPPASVTRTDTFTDSARQVSIPITGNGKTEIVEPVKKEKVGYFRSFFGFAKPDNLELEKKIAKFEEEFVAKREKMLNTAKVTAQTNQMEAKAEVEAFYKAEKNEAKTLENYYFRPSNSLNEVLKFLNQRQNEDLEAVKNTNATSSKIVNIA